MSNAKSYAIPKREIWNAWRRVRANRGAAGIDSQSIEDFEANLSKNLYRVWNRMSSGSYFPPPVLEVEIPKKDGGKRRLGIPTVADRVAQAVVKQRLESVLESRFDRDSYGYRPGRSAHDAIRETRKRCWRYDWIVEFDIKGAFDNIDHEMLMHAVKKHTADKWVLLYVQRWLEVPFKSRNGMAQPRVKGTPQGGVISPLLANLFLHYTFDLWMRREYPACPFARYADDGVIHCRSENEATSLIERLRVRFADCKLELHPEKTATVYCKDTNRRERHERVQFTFLGFTFRPRRARNKQGEVFTSFLPGVSKSAMSKMKQQIRRWRIPVQTPGTLEEFSERYDRVLRGWWNYYSCFYRTGFFNVFFHFDAMLARWARRKYKTLHRHIKRSHQWVVGIAKRNPRLFVHWRNLRCITTG